jgi:DNA polymerase elongation subunit (family B)
MEEASNPYIDVNIINWHYEDVKFSRFVMYGFGKNSNGENCTICIEDYKPEMYIRIRLNSDNNNDKNQFMIDLDSKSNENLKKKLLDSIDYICSKPLKCAKLKEKEKEKAENKESEESSSSNDNDFCCLEHCPQDLLSNPPYPINPNRSNIIRSLCKIENKKDLYESFGHNDIVALKIVFKTQMAFNRLKKALKYRIHNFDGSSYKNVFVTIYQRALYYKNYIIDTYKSDLPPLLDFFHNRDIQSCGWISFDKTKCKKPKTNSFVDSNVYYLSFKDINKLDKFEYAPFKIMSWDIEADSSHGDFPLAKKDYKKLGIDIADFYLDYINKNKNPDSKTLYNIFKYILCVAFNITNKYTLTTELEQKIKSSINTIYLKTELSNNDEDLLKDKEFIKKIMSICDKNKNKSLSSSNTTQLDRLFLNNINEDYDDDDKPKTDKKISNRDIIINKIMKIFEEQLPEVQGDRIIQIGCVFHKFGKKENKNYILTLGSCDKFDEETTIYPYANQEDINLLSIDDLDKAESNLITKFQDIIQEEQPDIILGYNTFGFDNKFLFNRVDELKLQDSFGYLGKMDKKTEIKIKILSSAALGDNILNIMPTIGRTEIDLLKIIQRDHNLDSYSLNNVSEKFIGDKKDDVTPKQIFEYQRANGEKRGIIAKYCVKDCVLLIDLMNKLDILSANIGMANVCSVPLEFIILRGQGIKIQSLVSKECKNENYVLRELEKINGDSSYEGAIVLQPSKGLYLEEPVSVLDYASLYPSSMIASNISHEGIVKTETYDDKNANLDEIEEINLYNMKDGIEFRYVEKYKKKIKNFNEEDFQNEIKSYNKFPLLDSIYLTTLKYRFIRKCKFKLYLIVRFYEKIKNKEEIKLKEFIETCKSTWNTMSTEEMQQYSRNVYYPKNKYLDKLTENEDSDNMNYIAISFDTYRGKGDKKAKCGVKRITFAHPVGIEQYDDVVEYPDQTISKRGIMPKILRKLLKARKDTRKKIPLEKDEFKKGVLEGLQLGYKLSANSLYGQCGASTSAIFKQDVAAACTSTGRQMLNLCSSFSKQYYDCDIVYGDSVTGDEPLILRNEKGLIEIKTIESLSEEWEAYENFKPFDTIQSNRRDKQKAFVNYQVFANNKWNPIKKVIRHKTNKKIYRVNTHCGVVDVTEDHSLLSDKREKIKPGECIVGETKLFHCFPNELCGKPIHLNEIVEELDMYENCVKTQEEMEAFIYGVFFGDGSCGYYNCKSGNKYSWAINNSNKKLLEQCRLYLKKLYGEMTDFKILNTKKSSGVDKLVPYGSIKYMVNLYRDLFYDKDKYKIIPNKILNGSYEVRKNFFIGYYAADGYKCRNVKTKNICFSNKGKIGSSQLYYLCKTLGYKVSINTRQDKLNIYKITCSLTKLRKPSNMLKKMIYLRDSEDEYVYDLETEFGTFCAGVGELEILNTDSIFLKYKEYKEDGVELKGKEKLRYSIQKSISLSDEIRLLLRKPHDLEYEKTFYPFILFSKKRYIGYLYEDDWNITPKLKYMGIVLKRRDNANIVKICYGGVITKLLEDKTIDSAVVFLKEKLEELITGQFDISDLTITKTLRGYYKIPQSIAHKVLADRMGERDPGNKPSSNDRIPYVYIVVKEKKGEKVLQGQKVESPDFIRENNIKIDYKFYLTNQIMKPVMQIFELCMKNPSEPFQETLNKLNRNLMGVKDISSYFT